MVNVIRKSFWVVWVCSLFVSVEGKEPSFFDDEEIVTFQIQAPLRSLKNQRGEEPVWLEGKVRIEEQLGEHLDLNVKIKARGNFRRKRSSCSFPSYWLNFKKKQVKGTVFDGIDSVKVVAHCREGKRSFEPYIYKEYLAYKTYQLLSDRSFKVRLARIEYIDSEGRNKPKEYVAFFIEHVKTFEKRLKSKQVKNRYVMPLKYDKMELCRAELYQYFVGNSDFSFFASQGECCHNAKVFRLSDSDDDYYPVPYDFDMSGLVNTPYASPNPKLPIDSVTERFYRGLKHDTEIIEAVVDQYQNRRHEIYELWEGSSLIDEKSKENALAAIDEFYYVLDTPTAFKKEILNRMRSEKRLEKSIVEKRALAAEENETK